MTATERERWNARYSERGVAPRPPSAWLVAQDGLLTPEPGARALDVACGPGRNALHLAARGYAVDAVDVSDLAVDALAAAAGERGLAVRARRADLAEPDVLERDAYAVVVVLFFLDRALFPALSSALAPGGLLVYETFTVAQLGRRDGPRDARMLVKPGELETAFGGFEVLRSEEFDDGAASTSRLLARRPPESGRPAPEHGR